MSRLFLGILATLTAVRRIKTEERYSAITSKPNLYVYVKVYALFSDVIQNVYEKVLVQF